MLEPKQELSSTSKDSIQNIAKDWRLVSTTQENGDIWLSHKPLDGSIRDQTLGQDEPILKFIKNPRATEDSENEFLISAETSKYIIERSLKEESIPLKSFRISKYSEN